MNRFEILDRMEEILNEKVRSVIPGMINCYLIEAPISKRHREAINVHITARGLIWNDYLGGVARTYQVEQLFLYHYNQGFLLRTSPVMQLGDSQPKNYRPLRRP